MLDIAYAKRMDLKQYCTLPVKPQKIAINKSDCHSHVKSSKDRLVGIISSSR
jgi:hypothetical protein